jgi:hypothetical protein
VRILLGALLVLAGVIVGWILTLYTAPLWVKENPLIRCEIVVEEFCANKTRPGVCEEQFLEPCWAGVLRSGIERRI